MYKNSKYTILFPLLLAAGVVLGLLLGQYMGRNSTTSQIKGMLRQMALPTNKLTYTLSLIENQYVDSRPTCRPVPTRRRACRGRRGDRR